MSEQKLIAESRTFEQQMIERDKRAVLFIFGKIRHDAQGVSAAA